VPRVDFYVTEDASPDARARLACRIVEKAYLADQRVIVRCASSEALARVDDLLWTFGDGSFVPHEAASTASQAQAPVILTTDTLPPGDWSVLVNLTQQLPADWQSYERVAEVLDADATTRAAGRDRFRAYRDAGVAPETHNLNATRS
jgi:DNA polymerase III subunit chi